MPGSRSSCHSLQLSVWIITTYNKNSCLVYLGRSGLLCRCVQQPLPSCRLFRIYLRFTQDISEISALDDILKTHSPFSQKWLGFARFFVLFKGCPTKYSRADYSHVNLFDLIILYQLVVQRTSQLSSKLQRYFKAKNVCFFFLNLAPPPF